MCLVHRKIHNSSFQLYNNAIMHCIVGLHMRSLYRSPAFIRHLRWGNVLSHKLEVGERRSPASHSTLTTDVALTDSNKVHLIFKP